MAPRTPLRPMVIALAGLLQWFFDLYDICCAACVKLTG